MWLHDGLIFASALALAGALQPWRAVAADGPPWPALAWCSLMSLLWSADRLSGMPLLQPLSGAGLLMLLVGWPLAMLMLVPVAVLMVLLADFTLADAVHRVVWLGVVPATLAMLLGAALRRWLPRHLFIYILGRGFFATAVATGAAGALSVWLHGAPAGLEVADLVLARLLAAWGDAFLAGGLVAIFVAFRPHWLATYADHIYLPARPGA